MGGPKLRWLKMLKRRIARRHVHVIDVGGNIVDRMRPGIREQRLEAMRHPMAVLSLQGLVAGVRAIAHQIKHASEGWDSARYKRPAASALFPPLRGSDDVGLLPESFPAPRSTHRF
jgi:hypothetical protein